jgi:hypothetical protein
VAQRPQDVGELLKTKFQPRFHRAKGSMRGSGNFPVAESLEKSELQRLPLKPRQHPHALLEKVTQIIQDENIICFAR